MGLKFLNHKKEEIIIAGALAVTLSLECLNSDYKENFIPPNQYHIEISDYPKTIQQSFRSVTSATSIYPSESYSGESTTNPEINWFSHRS